MNNDKVKELSKNYFNEQAENYDNGHDGKFVKVLYDEIINRVIECNPKTILDLGCGNGNILIRLEKMTSAKLYGLDLSEKMVEIAAKRLNANTQICIGDAEFLPYEDNSMDVVVCNASFHHYPNPVKVLQEIKRVLKRKGVLILGDPTAPALYLKLTNPCLHYLNSGDFEIYSKKKIIKMLNENGFETLNWHKVNYKTFIINAVPRT